MIGFHEVRFPEDVSWGSRGGPVYKTQVYTSHRGYEKRNVDWSQPMMEFNAAYGVKTGEHILNVINFFNARQGRLFGFRYKNWCNYQINEGPIATGDGFSRRLPIWKFYGFPGNRHYKRLRKIVPGSVVGVQAGNEPAIEGVDFRIDYDAGEIAFNTPLGYGIPVRAVKLEFDEPVRFEDDSIENVIEQYNNNALKTLNLVSVRGTFSAGSAFSPDLSEPGANDPYYGRTYLLLNFDGEDKATETVDQSVIQNPMTFHGSAALTKRAFRHGSSAFSAGTGYVSGLGGPYGFGYRPFTVEVFATQPEEGELRQTIVGVWEEPTNQRGWILRYNMGTQRLEFVASNDGAVSRTIFAYPWDASPGFFDHISIDRLVSGWWVLRINGEVKQTTYDSGTVNPSIAPLTVGGLSSPQVGEGSYQGLIDSIRITHGHPRSPGFDNASVPMPYGVTDGEVHTAHDSI